MATITIYAGKVGNMPGLIKDAKTAVNNLKSEFSSLKNKTLSVNSNICNLSDVISSISATVQTQEDKADALESFREKTEEFIEDAVQTDEEVAEKVNQNKDDFYDRYSYLKPDCEKTKWEKFCDGCKKVAEWCKENWVAIVTVIVVVAVAIAAVICGVAVAAVAAIAGVIGLVLCVADVICMIATGGKSIADLCNENGLGWLGQIFSGLSFGCDLVAIVFPIGAAIKTISKIGIKSFCKGMLASLKASFKEAVEAIWTKGFKVGFKDGLKNTVNLLVKTFIFDIDDITKVDDGKRVWNLMADDLGPRAPNKNWDVVDGKIYPSASEIPGDKRYNPDGLTMKELWDQTCAKLGIDADYLPMDKWGNPDFSIFSVDSSKIDMTDMKIDLEGYLSGDVSLDSLKKKIRDINFDNADKNLKSGKTFASLEAEYGIKLTRHELFDMQTVQYVPFAIHQPLGHVGGVGRYKFIIEQIPGQIDMLIKDIPRVMRRMPDIMGWVDTNIYEPIFGG